MRQYLYFAREAPQTENFDAIGAEKGDEDGEKPIVTRSRHLVCSLPHFDHGFVTFALSLAAPVLRERNSRRRERGL